MKSLRIFYLCVTSKHGLPLVSSCCRIKSIHSFRASNTLTRCSKSDYSSDPSALGALERARDFIQEVAGSKTLERFSPIIEFAILEGPFSSSMTASDVGSDHGLLAAALAVSGKFSRVVGSDVSTSALEEGAFVLKRNLQDGSKIPASVVLDYRYADGISEPTDVVCIAGMGVQTMLDILLNSSDMDRAPPFGGSTPIERLILQPAQARPKHLIRLRKGLQTEGWLPVAEKLSYVSHQWYVTTMFEQKDTASPEKNLGLPLGLVNKRDPLLRPYLEHHCWWLRSDQQFGPLKGGEDEWLETFETFMRLELSKTNE